MGESAKYLGELLCLEPLKLRAVPKETLKMLDLKAGHLVLLVVPAAQELRTISGLHREAQ